MLSTAETIGCTAAGVAFFSFVFVVISALCRTRLSFSGFNKRLRDAKHDADRTLEDARRLLECTFCSENDKRRADFEMRFESLPDDLKKFPSSKQHCVARLFQLPCIAYYEAKLDHIYSRLNSLTAEINSHSSRCLPVRKRSEEIIRSLRPQNLSERDFDEATAASKPFKPHLLDQGCDMASRSREYYGDATQVSRWLDNEMYHHWILEDDRKFKPADIETLLNYKYDNKANIPEKRLAIASHTFSSQTKDWEASLSELCCSLLSQVFMEYPGLVKRACPGRFPVTSVSHLEPWTLKDLKRCMNRLAALKDFKFCFLVNGLGSLSGKTEERKEAIKELRPLSENDMGVQA